MNINLEFDSHDFKLCQELIAYIENMQFKNYNKDHLLKKVKDEVELLTLMHTRELAKEILQKIGTNGCN